MKKHTICRLCSACCPVEVEIQEGRLARAERKYALPSGKRVQCPKLMAASDIVYSPERLKTPLIKKGNGFGDHFREASWDEALGLIADQFHHFKKKHGAPAVAWLRGMAADWGAPWDYATRLMHAFGSPNAIGNGSVCHVAREIAHNYTYGAMTLPQAKDARCIVVWGKNDRNTAPGTHEAIVYAREKGAKLIVIDPIRTPLAAVADIFLQIKPAHDGYLAMAMMHEIIGSGLYDKEFVEEFTVGFDDLKGAVQAYAPEKVAEATWLQPHAIKEAARLYATTGPACIIDGNGLDMQLQVFQATRAVCMLRALTGNLDRQGGDFIPQPVPVRNIQLKERLGSHCEPITSQYPLFNEFHSTWGLHAQSCLIDAIMEEKPYAIKMLVVQSGNPAVTMADSNRVRKALSKLDFMVSIDPFLTETGRFAHVVLPASSCFEKTQLNRAYIRNSPVMLQDQVIEPLADSWPDWKITFELARRIGLEDEFPWQSAEEAIDWQLEPTGMTVQMLRENPAGLRADKLQFEKHRSKGFATPSGKVEFYSKRLQDAGHPPVPYMDGKMGNPISFCDSPHEDLWVGISGERTTPYTHTQFFQVPSLLKRDPEGFIDVHPLDAQARGISQGDALKVETPRGMVRLKARISDVVHPGSLRIAWGWGGIQREANVNNLTDDDLRDPVTSTPSSRSFMCRVEKVGKEGEASGKDS